MPSTVTVFPVPTSLVSKLAVRDLALSDSPVTKPLKPKPVTVAAVVPSKTLLAAVAATVNGLGVMLPMMPDAEVGKV